MVFLGLRCAVSSFFSFHGSFLGSPLEKRWACEEEQKCVACRQPLLRWGFFPYRIRGVVDDDEEAARGEEERGERGRTRRVGRGGVVWAAAAGGGQCNTIGVNTRDVRDPTPVEVMEGGGGRKADVVVTAIDPSERRRGGGLPSSSLSFRLVVSRKNGGGSQGDASPPTLGGAERGGGGGALSPSSSSFREAWVGDASFPTRWTTRVGDCGWPPSVPTGPPVRNAVVGVVEGTAATSTPTASVEEVGRDDRSGSLRCRAERHKGRRDAPTPLGECRTRPAAIASTTIAFSSASCFFPSHAKVECSGEGGERDGAARGAVSCPTLSSSSSMFQMECTEDEEE